MVSLPVDAVSDNGGGNGGDLSNSQCAVRGIRIDGGDNTTFIFSGNGGNTLF
jgi:hypothetical protein